MSPAVPNEMAYRRVMKRDKFQITVSPGFPIPIHNIYVVVNVVIGEEKQYFSCSC